MKNLRKMAFASKNLIVSKKIGFIIPAQRYNAWVKLYSTFDYLSDNSMDMGTVWLIEDVK